MGRLENDTNIEKVEAMFFKVGKSLPLIPLIAHNHYVHKLCLHVKRLCLDPVHVVLDRRIRPPYTPYHEGLPYRVDAWAGLIRG